MDDAWAAEIGQRLQVARKAAHMSRRELGEAIGRNEGTVASYEQGKRAPFKEIREIARILNTDIAQILHGETYQSPLDRIDGRLAAIEGELRALASDARAAQVSDAIRGKRGGDTPDQRAKPQGRAGKAKPGEAGGAA